MNDKIHNKIKEILERKTDTFLQYNRTDKQNTISLSRFKLRYDQLDKEYCQLRWDLSRRNKNFVFCTLKVIE